MEISLEVLVEENSQIYQMFGLKLMLDQQNQLIQLTMEMVTPSY